MKTHTVHNLLHKSYTRIHFPVPFKNNHFRCCIPLKMENASIHQVFFLSCSWWIFHFYSYVYIHVKCVWGFFRMVISVLWFHNRCKCWFAHSDATIPTQRLSWHEQSSFSKSSVINLLYLFVCLHTMQSFKHSNILNE